MANLVAVQESNVVTSLQQWRTVMNQFLSAPKSIATPLNVVATGVEGGITLTWAAVKEATGYQVLMSQDGSFLDTVTFSLTDAGTTTYTDVTGATPVKRFYKLVATTGSLINPNSVLSKPSAEVFSTSLIFNQIVQTAITSASTNSITLVDMGLSASITVKGGTVASPTVIIVVTSTFDVISGSALDAHALLQVVRDTSTIVGSHLVCGYNLNTSAEVISFPFSVTLVDQPPAGSHTYKVQWFVNDTTTTVDIRSGSSAFMTVMQLV